MAQDWSEKRAARYDERIRQLFPGYERFHAAGLGILSERTRSGAPVLVVGAGTGYEANLLAESGFSVVGTDPSEAMLEVARRRAASPANPKYVVGDVSQLPEEPVFAAATLMLVLHFLPNDGSKAIVLREIARRSLPTATLVLADLVGEPRSPGHEAALRSWRAQVAMTSTPTQVERDFAAIESDVHFVSEAELDRLLTENGWQPQPAILSENLLTLRLAKRNASMLE